MEKVVKVNNSNDLVKYDLKIAVMFLISITVTLILFLSVKDYITNTVWFGHALSGNIKNLALDIFLLFIVALPAIFILTRAIQKIINNNLENKVKERTLQLSHALEGKSNFLANMSHEIRTPNHAVLNCSKYVEADVRKLIEELESYRKITNNPEIVESMLNISKSALKSACRIRDASNRQGVLLNNILDLSKLGEGKMQMNMGNHDLKSLISNVIIESEGLYKGGVKTLDVVFEETPIDTTAQFDSLRMTQVISNLLGNAVKYSAQGVITFRIRNSTIDINDVKVPSLECSISDEGIGIPPDELESVFEKFTESSATKKQSCGTGIGLAICQEIISCHHGKIWAENNKDKGSTFIFSIPIKNIA